ncbi:MAG TPA: hypothetical protein VFX20_12455 [Steroidobacteraceae bacterium]|nr:hypothetical protein [Steroidobacteraceae bacterium]
MKVGSEDPENPNMKSAPGVVRKIIWKRDLDEMEVIGTRMFSVGVPIEADPEFKAYVFAAGVTHSMGNSSVDAQLRRNRGKWIDSFRPEKSKPGSAEQLMKIVRTRALMRVHELTALDLWSDLWSRCRCQRTDTTREHVSGRLTASASRVRL